MRFLFIANSFFVFLNSCFIQCTVSDLAKIDLEVLVQDKGLQSGSLYRSQ